MNGAKGKILHTFPLFNAVINTKPHKGPLSKISPKHHNHVMLNLNGGAVKIELGININEKTKVSQWKNAISKVTELTSKGTVTRLLLKSV